MTQHHMRWARWNREGWRSQTHLSCAEPPPALQDGEHLSVAEAAIYLSAAKTNSETEKYRHTPSGGMRRGKKNHKCKYFKRSLPLYHCWLCLILWASTNNGRWDFFLSQPKKKHCCYLCHCYATSKWAQCGLCKKVHPFYISVFFGPRPLLKPI